MNFQVLSDPDKGIGSSWKIDLKKRIKCPKTNHLENRIGFETNSQILTQVCLCTENGL